MARRRKARGLKLKTWLQHMVAGDLEFRVSMSGRDEITMYARVLDALRQSLIRSRDLTRELAEKNDILSETLDTLRRTQDQIVSQQKLAELGELSAGVAHEIRNPLQFIKNFSESSAALAEELAEELDELDAGDAREEIDEISTDLTENMRRIVEHTGRADRIVSDMLDLRRQGAEERREIDVERLLTEQTMLAYQAIRSHDEGFDADIRHDFAGVGAMRVAPRDFGRVVVNVVTNACHALAARATAEEGFAPVLTLATRRTSNEVEIAIGDNGPGMDDDVRAKIFNPFYTTKPPGEGTGRGLSLSHEIVREHGGNILADTAPGQGTTMRIRLPHATAANVA